MVKTPVKLTEEELKQMIKFESGIESAEVAEGVFKKLFEDARSKMDNRISKIIYGGIIATGLVIIALCYSTWLFMSSYQQNYLDTQSEFNKQVNDLRKENSDQQLRFESDLKSIQEKQNYFERLLVK